MDHELLIMRLNASGFRLLSLRLIHDHLSHSFHPLTTFAIKAPSLMFDRVLNMPVITHEFIKTAFASELLFKSQFNYCPLIGSFTAVKIKGKLTGFIKGPKNSIQ